MEIPVYLFTGFLESGKTKFISETLQDPRFNDGTPTLLVVCEEGFEEYDPSGFASPNVFMHVVEKESDLTPLKLGGACRRAKAQRVLVEYNGMWQINSLLKNLPEEWVLYQNFLFFDTTTFVDYNTNMRSLVVDKLNVCELCVFNRFENGGDKQLFHKIVRATNRRTDIAYESSDGVVEYDDMEDPLPFDVNAQHIVIEDRDYALWYRDLSEELEKYDKKNVTFTCMVKNKAPNANCFVVGRPLMTCCQDDIRFAGLVCSFDSAPEKGDWIRLTARIHIKKHKLYNRVGPVLEAIHVQGVDAPQDEVATFF